jgi:hypothetical protein
MALAAVVGAALIAAAAASARGGRVDLGHFAGYVWDGGPVTEVSATFTVPRILTDRRRRRSPRRGSAPRDPAASMVPSSRSA